MEEEGEEDKKMKFACKLKFFSWTTTMPNDWDSWVKNMCSVHQSTWKNAGIYEAIMSSTYIIQRHEELILELASRWCSETNTFVFPWGNATLTLEDLLVLGGFSASGVSALSSLENDVKSHQINERLEIVRTEIVRSKVRAALQGKWITKFKDCGSDLEHAAFVTLWLSRYVFPSSTHSKVINKQVIPVAAMLSRGIRVALGPVVLAMIYRDLGLLEKSLHFTRLLAHLESEDSVNLCAPFHLVQIWAWERFPTLRPVPNYTVDNFPRLARWSNVKIRHEKDLRSAIDAAGDAFLWRPYGSSFGRRREAFELIGFDSCIEKYQPQLVPKQFGLDHDILNEDVDKNMGQIYSTSRAAKEEKVENAVDCARPGTTPQIEVIILLDSDSDHECSIYNKNASKSEPVQTQAEVCHVDESYEADKQDNEGQLVYGHHPNVVSLPSNNESNKGMGNAGTKQDEIEGKEGTSCGFLGAENSSSFDVETYANERFGDSGLDLETRISRLEDIVYKKNSRRPGNTVIN